MMKYFFILILLLAASCAHHDHGHHEHDWKSEIKQSQIDHKETQEVFSWFESRIKDHGEELSEYLEAKIQLEKQIALYEKQGNGLLAKKTQLKLGRLNQKNLSEHHHFESDQYRFLKIFNKLRQLKFQFESHDHGHHH